MTLVGRKNNKLFSHLISLFLLANVHVFSISDVDLLFQGALNETLFYISAH